jgi:lipocalin
LSAVLKSAQASVFEADLEDRIFEAERAVIARDERLREHTQEFTQRLQVATGKGARMALGVAAGIGVATVAWKLLSRQRRRPSVLRTRARLRRKAVASKPPGVPWMQWLSVVSPLLPFGGLGLPKGKSPSTLASFIVAAGVPLLKRSLDHRGSTTHHAPVPASEVDLQRLAGDWYEVARLPFHEEGVCAGDVTTTYVLEDPTTVRVINRCRRPDGAIDVAEGVARVTDPVTGSRMEICYAPSALKWVPWVWSDYWILHVEADYRMALVGTPDRRHLWLLARQPVPSAMEYQWLINQVRNQGYDPAKLKRTPQPAPAG